MEIDLIFCLCFYLLCRRGNNHFDVYFRRKMEKTRSVREEMDGRAFIFRERRHFSFDNLND